MKSLLLMFFFFYHSPEFLSETQQQHFKYSHLWCGENNLLTILKVIIKKIDIKLSARNKARIV